MSLGGMNPQAIGNHELTFGMIYSLMNSIFENKLHQNVPNTDAAKLLYIAYGIRVDNNIFTTVRLGDIDVLITDGYYGKRYRDMVYDIAKVNNRTVLFVFKDALTNPKIPERVKLQRMYTMFNMLVTLYTDININNISPNTIYNTIIYYAPVVMSIKLYEYIYCKEFPISSDYKYLLGDPCWLDKKALDIIHQCTDSALLEYGALVEYVGECEGRFSSNENN